jgi:inner membrane protease subunit 2
MSNRPFSAFRRNTPSGQFIKQFSGTLFVIATWVPAVIFFNENVGEVTQINGPSMYPYLNTSYNESMSKDICWVNKWKPTSKMQRGMLITFRYFSSSVFRISHADLNRSPSNPESLAIKRIIALPEDRVITRAPYPTPIADIPANHVWVEGDNKDGTKTLDSNYYGPISMSLIEGRVTRVLWPWRSAGPIQWQEFKGRTKVIKRKESDLGRGC